MMSHTVRTREKIIVRGGGLNPAGDNAPQRTEEGIKHKEERSKGNRTWKETSRGKISFHKKLKE